VLCGARHAPTRRLKAQSSTRTPSVFLESKRAAAKAEGLQKCCQDQTLSRARSPQSRSAMHGWASKTIYTSATANKPQSGAPGSRTAYIHRFALWFTNFFLFHALLILMSKNENKT